MPSKLVDPPVLPSAALFGRAVRPLAPGVRLGVPAAELLSGELIEPIEGLLGAVMLLSGVDVLGEAALGAIGLLGVALLGEDMLGDRVLSEEDVLLGEEDDARL